MAFHLHAFDCQAAEPIADYSASYSVQYNSLTVGELNQTLSTLENGDRLLRSETRPRGLVSLFRSDNVEEQSRWRDYQGTIQPLEYRYERTGRRPKFLHMLFDWQDYQLDMDDKKHPWSLTLKPGTLDRLIYQLAVMRDLSNGEQELQYHIADGGKLKHHEILILETETVSTSLGTIEAVKLVRDRDDDSDRQTILWCAPSLGYLTVKLQHIEKDGATFTASLRELTGRDTSVFTPEQRPVNNPGFRTTP
uniref:DUF3108 domain-containing protein n=1 Tax=Methylophaga lonarensis TaxID=999151 RepID=UPI002E0D6522